MRNSKEIYFNNPQQEFLYTAPHTTVIVGGRRLGKSHGFAAPFLLRNFQHMPRSSNGIVGSTYQQLLTRTLPGTFQALESFGYKRNQHFFVGHKPPKSANFKTPYIEPASYDHIVSFYNGSIGTLISQDRPGSSNSLTLDSLLIDEGRFINYEKLKTETFPANGGFKGHFGHLPWHHSILILSDMPPTQKRAWFEHYKDDMDADLVDVIQALVHEIWKLKQEYILSQDPLIPKHIKTLRKTLAQFQSISVYYREWSSLENLLLLGERYFQQMKRDLPPLVFQTSILCKRLRLIKDGFYPGLNQNVHYYTAFDNSYLDSLDYNFTKINKQSCKQDADLDKTQPIFIALDYNANINWIVAGQMDGIKMKVLKSFYVKYERKLRELVNDFCDYYRDHATKEVVYYFDNTAIGNNYAVGTDDFAHTVTEEFNKRKWKVKRVHIGNPVKHIDKHRMIHLAFQGVKYLFPMFNKPNNEALLLAIENTGVRIGSRGFSKDKAGEKLNETDTDLLEHRTDATDAFDTLFIGMNKFPTNGSDGAITSHFA